MAPHPLSRPRLEQQRLRSFVPLSTGDLLDRYEFRPAGEMDDTPERRPGDELHVRHARLFSVRVLLPRKGSRSARVWVGRRNGKGVTWGQPKAHRSDIAAVTDAVSLASTFLGAMVGGD